MYIKAAHRSRLTTSLFTSTFLLAVLTVGAPQLLPCPANANVEAEAKEKNKLDSGKEVIVRERDSK